MNITPPTYFQTPNDLVDHWLPHLGEAEVKVLLVIFRKTFGWHKIRDRISLSQMENITGLNRTNASRATKALLEKGIISKEVIGKNGQQETYYELVILEDSNISDRYRKDTPPSAESVPPPVPERYPQKKPYKKTFIKEPPPKPSNKKTKKEEVGGFFECLKEIKISDKDKVRISNSYDESLVIKVLEYISRPEFKPKGTIDRSIFYFCKNPDHMTESQKERDLKEQKAKDEQESKIENRRQHSTLLEKYCRIYLKQRNRDISLVRWSQNYIEFGSGENECKIYYKDGGFRDKIEKNLMFHEIALPDWIKDID